MNTRNGHVEWRTLSLVLLAPVLWLGAGLLWMTQYWWIGLLVMPVLAAFHTSLQHETIHGHPTPWNWLNEVLVSLPLAAVFPYRRYRDLHLRHHNDLNLTDPYEDPESYFWPESSYKRMRGLVRAIFRANNTFAGRLLIGPALTIVGFIRTEFVRLRVGEGGVRFAWFLHICGLIPLVFIVVQIFQMPIWVYLVAVIYPAMSLTSMRAYAEHQAAENVGGRSAIVESGPVMSLLYLNNNLHIVHHAHPGLPWYEIPTLYRERKLQYLAANENTLFNGYSDIARRFAFCVKQPVDHPFMYRDEQISTVPNAEAFDS